MRNYFVVPFTYEDVQENRDVDFNIELELALVGTEQDLRKDSPLEREALEAIVRFYRRSTSLSSATEYDQYSEVIFLNEAAMMICRDRGLVVNVLKIIPEEDLPKDLGLQCQKPYLPNTDRGR